MYVHVCVCVCVCVCVRVCARELREGLYYVSIHVHMWFSLCVSVRACACHEDGLQTTDKHRERNPFVGQS